MREYFFARLASMEHHTNGEPIFELRKQLAKVHSDNRSHMNVTYAAAITIKAWNKYRDGEKIQLLKWRQGGAAPELFPEPR